MRNIGKKLNLFYLLSFLITNVLSAQTLNLQTIPGNKMQFGFSFNKPFYSENSNMSTSTGVYQLYFNIPVSSKLNIIGSIPYINTSGDIDYGFGKFNYSENGLGNIFIGLQTVPGIRENRKSIFSFGLSLPTADEEAATKGLMADYYGIQKYVPKSLGVYFNYAYHKLNKEGFRYGFELGPNLLIPTKSNGAETEFYMHYGINTGYQVNKLLFNVEFIGIAIISEDIDNFGDRFKNSINFGLQWKETKVIPKIFYKIYLKKEMRDRIDGVLGIGVSVSI